MALTNEQITAKNFKDFYTQIRPYLNGAAHSGFTPVGTVISVMGNSAPMNYLACNGQVVNIADYPELATYFNTQFGSPNYFGGNGTTTFGIPDLRGEFLRGTGTNGHTGNGDGATVGTHQDATKVPRFGSSAAKGSPISYGKDIYVTGSDKDSGTVTHKCDYVVNNSMGEDTISNDVYPMYSTRPTNTSVLYCIATKNIFMDAGSNYSTEEQVVGTWTNGKPIYQITKDVTLASDNVNGAILLANDYHVDDLISYSGTLYGTGAQIGIPFYFTENNRNYSITVQKSLASGSVLYRKVATGDFGGLTARFTLRYTKTTD